MTVEPHSSPELPAFRFLSLSYIKKNHIFLLSDILKAFSFHAQGLLTFPKETSQALQDCGRFCQFLFLLYNFLHKNETSVLKTF